MTILYSTAQSVLSQCYNVEKALKLGSKNYKISKFECGRTIIDI